MLPTLAAGGRRSGGRSRWSSTSISPPSSTYALKRGSALTTARVGFFLEQHRDELFVEEQHLEGSPRACPATAAVPRSQARGRAAREAVEPRGTRTGDQPNLGGGRVMLSREQLQRAAADSGFQVESYEKVHVLVRLLEAMRTHPFLGPRMALKGGTALNLFVLDLPTALGGHRPELRRRIRPRDDARRAASRRAGAAAGHWPHGPHRQARPDRARRRQVAAVVRDRARAPGQASRSTSTSCCARRCGRWLHATPILSAERGPPRSWSRRARARRREARRPASRVARAATSSMRESCCAARGWTAAKLRLGFVVYGGVNREDWRAITR